jgi:hypothetical protein
MAVDLNILTPDFKTKVSQLLAQCKNKEGIEMHPNEGVRDPFKQARYWRQSRPASEIKAKINELKTHGANFLAHCIESVGPQQGPHVTNAIPGLSWHQFGEALDCFWLVNGHAEWSITKLVNGKNGFHVYASLASHFGLDAGGLWTSLKDWPHVQLSEASSPLNRFTLQEIDAKMRELFGD